MKLPPLRHIPAAMLDLAGYLALALWETLILGKRPGEQMEDA